MNQEKAPKIRESFSNFIDLVYSDNASIVRKIDDKIEVDKGLHLQFYEMTAGLYQTIRRHPLWLLSACTKRKSI